MNPEEMANRAFALELQADLAAVRHRLELWSSALEGMDSTQCPAWAQAARNIEDAIVSMETAGDVLEGILYE